MPRGRAGSSSGISPTVGWWVTRARGRRSRDRSPSTPWSRRSSPSGRRTAGSRCTTSRAVNRSASRCAGNPAGRVRSAFSGDGRLFATTQRRRHDRTLGRLGGPSLLSTPLDGQLRLFDASTDGTSSWSAIGPRPRSGVLDAPDAAPIVLSPPADPNVQVWWDLSADGSRVLGGAVVEPESGGASTTCASTTPRPARSCGRPRHPTRASSQDSATTAPSSPYPPLSSSGWT